jgi:hypothetical protein
MALGAQTVCAVPHCVPQEGANGLSVIITIGHWPYALVAIGVLGACTDTTLSFTASLVSVAQERRNPAGILIVRYAVVYSHSCLQPRSCKAPILLPAAS